MSRQVEQRLTDVTFTVAAKIRSGITNGMSWESVLVEVRRELRDQLQGAHDDGWSLGYVAAESDRAAAHTLAGEIRPEDDA